mgnify:CR=1 FL=1
MNTGNDNRLYYTIMHVLLAIFIAYSFLVTFALVVVDKERREYARDEHAAVQYIRSIQRKYEEDCR